MNSEAINFVKYLLFKSNLPKYYVKLIGFYFDYLNAS